jgi:hypothetical protein
VALVVGRELRTLLDFAGKHFVDIIPANLVSALSVGDSNKVFSHLVNLIKYI